MAFTAKVLGLARAAITAAGSLVDAAVRTLTAAWVRAWDILAGAFHNAVERLLDGRDAWPGRRTIDQDPGIRAAVEDAQAALDALTDLTVAQIGSAAAAAADQAARDQAAIIAAQLPSGRDMSRRGFHQQAIDAIVARARQRIISLTRPLTRDVDIAMRHELIRGVTLGSNPRDAASRMVRQVERAFNGGLNRALVIARTEALDAYRQAAAAVQDASSDVLDGWMWLAKLDGDRTCVACWAMHGTQHPLSEPGPLGHPACRCSRAPKTKSWRDLGFDLDEPADAIPDAETLFRALPRDVQQHIMGAARLNLLDSGDITWADLVQRRDNPGWRDSYMPTSIRGLAPAG